MSREDLPPGVTMRISNLPSMCRCPGFVVAQMVEDRSTAAADTGSFVGRVIQLWHELGEDPIAFEAARRQSLNDMATQWPNARVDEALHTALMYACDPRNQGTVVKGSCEKVVELTLAPAPEDPTGKPVKLWGHVDQLRFEKATGRYRLWDTKNGAQTGLDMLYGYAWQLAAYSLGYTALLGQPVLPGGIIRLQGYGNQGSKRTLQEAGGATVFFEAPWSLEACESMMRTAVQHIAWLRSGIIHLQPGAHCAWCPGGGPHTCGDFIGKAYPQGVSL